MNMNIWRMIASPAMSGQENMALDIEMFEGLKQGKIAPTWRVYTWKEPCVTIGRAMRLINIEYQIAHLGLPVLQRPTGGGLVIHESQDELTFGVTFYRERGELIQSLYKKIHQPIIDALVQLDFPATLQTEFARENGGPKRQICFQDSPCLYDGLLNGKKILGGGLRVSGLHVLYQGTLKLPNLPMKQFIDMLSLYAGERETCTIQN